MMIDLLIKINQCNETLFILIPLKKLTLSKKDSCEKIKSEPSPFKKWLQNQKIAAFFIFISTMMKRKLKMTN